MSACLCKRKFKFGFFVKQNAALLSTFRASVDNKHWQSSSIFLCLMSDLECIPSLSMDSGSDCGLQHSHISFELMTFILPETPANSLQYHFLSPGKCTKSKYPFLVVVQLRLIGSCAQTDMKFVKKILHGWKMFTLKTRKFQLFSLTRKHHKCIKLINLVLFISN